jgi:hypothetical protein
MATSMARYGALPAHVRNALLEIEPSRDGKMAYFPCRAILADGRAVDTVYIVPEMAYLRHWGIYPEDDKGKNCIWIEDVAEVEESAARLPARYANEVYSWDESGMGYNRFTVVFADGSRHSCISGNAVDFICYPKGKGPGDVIAIARQEEKKERSLVKGPRYYWCLYSELEG